PELWVYVPLTLRSPCILREPEVDMSVLPELIVNPFILTGLLPKDSVPLPATVRLFEVEGIEPHSDSVCPLTVMVGLLLPPNVIEPVPMFRLLVPPKVNEPFHVCVLLCEEKVIALPEVLSIVVLAPMVKLP